jgi:hypothetical protein
MFGGSKRQAESAGRTSAEGGNGNVRNSRGEHSHEAISTPNLAAVRNLAGGTSGYVGRHRAE